MEVRVPRAAAAALLAVAACGGSDPLVERAIDRRGPGLGSSTREVEARVSYGFPGLWRWEMAFRAPDRFRISLATQAATQHYVYEEGLLRGYLGAALVAESAEDGTPLRSIARWLEVTSLDVLADSGRIAWTELGPQDVPEGAERSIAARFRDNGDRYVLAFDAAARLVAAEGPIDVPGIGAGRLTARFEAFRSVDGYELPFESRYWLNEEPFFEERVVRWIPNAAVIDPTERSR